MHTFQDHLLLTEATNLSRTELLKYDWRLAKFIEKYKKGDPFTLVNGKEITLEYDEVLAQKLLSKTFTSSLRLKDKNNTLYSLSDFKKTAEFGGKSKEVVLAKENIALDGLNSELEQIKTETGLVEIPIKIGKTIYHVTKAESTPTEGKAPKSDIQLLDKNNVEVVWLSHKDGSKVTDFQQWGGISAAVEPRTFNHPETQAFIKAVQDETKLVMPRSTTYARPIHDPLLKNLATYGNKFGQGFGRQNVTALLQGPITLKKSGDHYVVQANHIKLNGEDVGKPDAEYTPVFMAVYRFDRNSFGIKYARLFIQPFGSRKITKIL